MTVREIWVFFLITWVIFNADGKPFKITTSSLKATQGECHRLQSEINVPHGEELLVITPCVKVPERGKS